MVLCAQRRKPNVCETLTPTSAPLALDLSFLRLPRWSIKANTLSQSLAKLSDPLVRKLLSHVGYVILPMNWTNNWTKLTGY